MSHDRDCMAVGFTGQGRCIEPATVGSFCEGHARRHEQTGWDLYGELVDRWNRERLHYQAVIDELKSLLRRACEADAREDCRFDHSGDCQAHGPWGDGEPCPYPFIRQYLSAEAKR